LPRRWAGKKYLQANGTKQNDGRQSMNQQSANIKRMAAPLAAALFLALAGCASGPAPDDRLNATLWMQQAVEYKAATDGVYALASIRLTEALADPGWTAVPDIQNGDFSNLPPAIILDADETVLDNSAYQAGLIKTGGAYSPEGWNAYANSGSAGAVPGAVAFTQAAAANGVTVFYVTNRDVITEEATTNNLAALGFPMDGIGGGKVDTVMTKNEQPDWTSRKGTRRAAVAKDYRVLLLLGDNFGDFTDDYRGSPEERRAVYEAHRKHWGRDWLMLPNPAYGSWEAAAFGGDYTLSEEEKRRRKIDSLTGWAANE
jgi:5'-nucleotidase (lipoprotein e(P4) family)